MGLSEIIEYQFFSVLFENNKRCLFLYIARNCQNRKNIHLEATFSSSPPDGTELFPGVFRVEITIMLGQILREQFALDYSRGLSTMMAKTVFVLERRFNGFERTKRISYCPAIIRCKKRRLSDFHKEI
jgi:hypothetical protein